MRRAGTDILIIDNYDSFVYILAQYLGELGANPGVYRHDAISVQEIRDLNPAGILISPGPGRTEDAGISNDVIRELAGEIPILGVCLGMQCLGEIYGGKVTRAKKVMHGKTSTITHDSTGVFAGLPNPLEATRYHSLIVERDSVPDVLTVTATSDDGNVMGLRHRELDLEGVQFHPESILTNAGHDLLKNWLGSCS